MDRSEKIALFVFLGVIVLGLCLAITFGLTLYFSRSLPGFQNETTLLTQTPQSITPTQVIQTPDTSQEIHTFTESPKSTLDSLKETDIPEVNWFHLAEEFNGLTDAPKSLTTSPEAYKDGDVSSFWVLDEDSNSNNKVTATLQYQTSVVYFWVENGINFDKQTLKKDAETFTNQIYPTDQEFFGKEWTPGVDNDPHIYILYTKGLGSNVAGYESDSDEYLTQVQKYSNQHEMFYINADIQTLSDPYTLSVMAHEFQHLIHTYHDANEELWLNEGFSELATYLNGYSAGGFDGLFAANPDINLTEWPNNSTESNAHYGSGFLFTAYLLDRFGEKTTQAVVADPLNGLASLDDVFSAENLVDPQTKQMVTSDGFFQDWTLANYINDTQNGDGRYGYHNLTRVPDFTESKSSETCDGMERSESVNQYGTDYIGISCSTPFSINFIGAPTVNILSEFPQEGSHYLWSNMSDSSDTRMTHTFDFSQISGEITLTYDVWYDLEEDYDFVYLLASTDGKTWKILNTPSCTSLNKTGNNFGCAYNGSSSSWIHQQLDLSQFAGEKVQLKFEYITDAGVTGEGFVIDNIAIPQIDYQTGFEVDNGGWQLAGFARIENQIPQTFLVSVVQRDGNTTTVEKYLVNGGQSLKINIKPTGISSETTLVVSGSARYTRQKANYQFEISASP